MLFMIAAPAEIRLKNEKFQNRKSFELLMCLKNRRLSIHANVKERKNRFT